MIGEFLLLVPSEELLGEESSRELQRLIEEQSESKRPLIISLRYVKVVDAVGVDYLLQSCALLEERGISVLFIDVSRHVQQLFSMVQLGDLVQLFNSFDEAIYSLVQQ